MTAVKTICIVGVGLMGGSLALALRQPAPGPEAMRVTTGSGAADGQPLQHGTSYSGGGAEGQMAALAGWATGKDLGILGVGRDRAALARAQAVGALDDWTVDLAAGVSQADIVILAMPVRTILRLLPEVGRAARPGTLVLDLGSSKTEICAALEQLPEGLQPVGGHPLCGKEKAGFDAADVTLYRGRPFVLCPLPRTAPDALATAQGLALAIGARPVVLSPGVHDRAVAAISHLPYALAVSLVTTVMSADETAWGLAASGFRDTSRVAASDVDMMLDTLLTNRAAVLAWMDVLSGEWAQLRDALAAGDEAALRTRLEAARARRIAAAQAAGW